MFWGCVGGVLVAFWGCFGDVLGDALGMFWWCFGDVLVMFWGCFGDDLGVFLQPLPPSVLTTVFTTVVPLYSRRHNRRLFSAEEPRCALKSRRL